MAGPERASVHVLSCALSDDGTLNTTAFYYKLL